AVPAHDGCRNFVADGEAKQRRMARTPRSLLSDPRDDGADAITLIEERHVLLPGKAGHDVQPAPLSLPEKPNARFRIRANRVEPALGHRGEVTANLPMRAEADAVFVLSERAVRNPAKPQASIGHCGE